MDELVKQLTQQNSTLQDNLVTLTGDICNLQDEKYDLEHDIELLKKEHEVELLKLKHEVDMLKLELTIKDECLRAVKLADVKSGRCPFKNSEGVVVCPVTNKSLSEDLSNCCGVDDKGCGVREVREGCGGVCPCEPKVGQ